jgi:hypothetical protein
VSNYLLPEFPNSSVAFLVPRGIRVNERARVVASLGYLGSHKMALKRVTKDPMEARPYQPSDPVRLIDWKAFARTDQLIVRQKRDQARIKVRFMINFQSTMLWPDKNVLEILTKKLPTKLELAIRISFSLAYDHSRRGDEVEFVFVGLKRQAEKWTPKSSSDILRAFERLSSLDFEQDELMRLFEHRSTSTVSSVKINYVFTDFLEHADPKWYLSQSGVSVFFHMFSCLERNPDWLANNWTYYDEGHAKEYERTDISESLKEQVQGWTLRTKGLVGNSNIYIEADEFTKVESIELLLSKLYSQEKPGGR